MQELKSTWGELEIPGVAAPTEGYRKYWLMEHASPDYYSGGFAKSADYYWRTIGKRWEWWEVQQGKRWVQEERLK
jgi:hypothetical protein